MYKCTLIYSCAARPPPTDQPPRPVGRPAKGSVVKVEGAEEFIDFPAPVNGRLPCTLCDKTLANKKSYELHWRLHTGNKLKTCPTCSRGFSKLSHLHRHQKIHIQRQYDCDYCDETFQTPQERRLHLRIHTAVAGSEASAQLLQLRAQREMRKLSTVYDAFYCSGQPNRKKRGVCKICDEKFERVWELRKHLQAHADDEMSVIKSGAVLFDRPELFEEGAVDVTGEPNEVLAAYVQRQLAAGNWARFYSLTNSQSWEMALSDSETDGEPEAKDVKAQLYGCAGCSTYFDRIHKVVAHMKITHGNAEFPAENQCSHCYKIFPCAAVLMKHLRAQCENREKPIVCKVCRARFMWPANYEAHKEVMHSKSSVYKDPIPKSFACEVCAKSFFRAEHLERHRKIHEPQEKSFSCDMCKKKFNRKDNLK